MKSAVILAAGEGARAWPYCGVRQKATVPVLNVPLVRRIALDLRALGVEEIVTVVGHRAADVRACLGDLEAVRFIEQRERTGPVDAALLGLSNVSTDTVLLCYGDIATTRETLGAVVQGFGARNADALLLVAACPPGLTASRTTIEVTTDGLVGGVWGRGGTEHPRFGGVAAANTDLLRQYLLRTPGIMPNVGVGAMPPPEGDPAYAFELMRRDGIEVHAVMADDFLVDMDKPWHILEANHQAAKHAIDALDRTVIAEGATIHDSAEIPAGANLVLGRGAEIGPGCHIGGSLVLGAGSRIISGAMVGGGAIIGEGSRCEKYCDVADGSVIGNGCVVSHCAEFNGVTFDVVFLYHYCSLTGLIGAHVDVGAATVCGSWRFDDSTTTQEVGGRKETPECHGNAVFIGDHCRTGVNVTFMPGVKVGYYTCVGGGAVVYDDVPERTLLLAKQEHVLKPWGPEKYNW